MLDTFTSSKLLSFLCTALGSQDTQHSLQIVGGILEETFKALGNTWKYLKILINTFAYTQNTL